MNSSINICTIFFHFQKPCTKKNTHVVVSFTDLIPYTDYVVETYYNVPDVYLNNYIRSEPTILRIRTYRSKNNVYAVLL